MKTDFVAQEDTWVVLIEKNPAELVQVHTGQQFTTGQICEQFIDENAAIERATVLGWEPHVEPDFEVVEEAI